MRKVIKIGFPILCISVIIGTFILLNKTTDKITRNRLDEEDTLTANDTESPENTIIRDVSNTVSPTSVVNTTKVSNTMNAVDTKNDNVTVTVEEAKTQKYR